MDRDRADRAVELLCGRVHPENSFPFGKVDESKGNVAQCDAEGSASWASPSDMTEYISTAGDGADSGPHEKPVAPRPARRGAPVAVVAAIAALGVVFGDIGTSPLYA